MIPTLKDQELDMKDGVLQSKPQCPTCKERDAFVYNALREQFQCGKCWHDDYQVAKEIERQDAHKMLARIKKQQANNAKGDQPVR